MSYLTYKVTHSITSSELKQQWHSYYYPGVDFGDIFLITPDFGASSFETAPVSNDTSLFNTAGTGGRVGDSSSLLALNVQNSFYFFTKYQLKSGL